MPSASVRTTTAVNPEFLRDMRSAKRQSRTSVSSHAPARASLTCLWRIDTVGVKRSDSRGAQQPRTQTPDDLMEVFPWFTGYWSDREFRKITQPLVSDIRIDSEVAIETSGDLRLVVTQADSAFALPLRYGCDGC